MMEYELLFSTTLHQKLKEKVIGTVYVKVNSMDRLYIYIRGNGDMEFKTYIDNFSDRIRNGWTTDYAVYEVLREYKNFIRNLYFK